MSRSQRAQAQAVNVPGKVGEMRQRPPGGVLSITEARPVGPAPMADSAYEWATDPYDLQELATRTEHARNSSEEFASPFSIFTREKMKKFRGLVSLFRY